MDIKLTKTGVFLLLWDIAITFGAYSLAVLFSGKSEVIFVNADFVFSFAWLAIANVAGFMLFRLYNHLWQYAGHNELWRIAAATFLGTVFGAIVQYLAGERLNVLIYVFAFALILIFTGGGRYALYLLDSSKKIVKHRSPMQVRLRTLIVGAGEAGSHTIKRMTSGDFKVQGLPVAVVDDDPAKLNMRINDVRVVASTDQIAEVVNDYNIQQIVFAMASASPEQRKRVYELCASTGCKLQTLPAVKEMTMDELNEVHLRKVNLTDLLAREEVVLHPAAVSGYLENHTVLITGGGGSIGSELARQICAVKPRSIIIFDIYENTSYELAHELLSQFPTVQVFIEIGTVCDKDRLSEVFEQYRPEVIFHAAAHKHVPLMESNPREAVLNNIYGTLNLLRCSVNYGVHNFIFISTDKAVNPTNVMGATKRFCELMVQHFATYYYEVENAASEHKCIFTTVRFGNVLGSHGSAVPIFERQIALGGPVTITHPEVERYFMTIREAVTLVLMAGQRAQGGEIFVLDMGEPVRVLDMVKNMISLSGMVPDKDIKIEFTGLRPGEKLVEELTLDCETLQSTDVPKLLVSTADNRELAANVSENLVALKEVVRDSVGDPAKVKYFLQTIVPNYVPEEQ